LRKIVDACDAAGAEESISVAANKGKNRMRFLILMASVSAAMLGGCGKSEEQAKADFRSTFLSGCNKQMGSKLQERGIDAERFCACSVDSMMKGRTAAEIDKMDRDDALAEEASAKAAGECIAQQQAAAAPPPAAAAPEPAAAEEETEEEGQ
jgi:hypothetical protein